MGTHQADPTVHATSLTRPRDHKWQFPLKSSKASLAINKAESHKGVHSSILQPGHLAICGKDNIRALKSISLHRVHSKSLR